MLEAVKAKAKGVLGAYTRWLCKREWERQAFHRFNERPVELAFVFRKLGELYPRTVLDVGTGTTALPHLMRNCGCLVTAIDNVRDYWPAGMTNRHYHVVDDDITATRLRDTFDLVTCVSVLEHVHEADKAVRNMLSLLAPGGSLLLTFPYNEKRYVRNVYELPGSSYGQDAPYITQAFSRAEIDRWLAASGAALVEQEYWEYWEGEYWTVGRQIIPPRRASADAPHQLTCLHLRKA